jgi:hypothetical protein
MKMLRLYSTTDLEACPLDKWGILDPGLVRRDVEGSERRKDSACNLLGEKGREGRLMGFSHG